MNLAATIKKLCKQTHVTVAELARRSGQSSQNLSKKLNNETIKFDEFTALLTHLGARFDYVVSLPGQETPTEQGNDRTKEKIGILETQLKLEERNLEYIKELCRDMRTALYNVNGNTDKAIKHSRDRAGITEYLHNIQTAGTEIGKLLDEALSFGAAPTSDTEPPYGPEFAAGKRALLVDDNTLSRELTRVTLEDNGILVEDTYDGKHAVEMIKNAVPGYYDFVLMDVRMPGMDGLETTGQIRALDSKLCSGVPIIGFTAGAFAKTRQNALDAGMDGCIPKPIVITDLFNVLYKLFV